MVSLPYLTYFFVSLLAGTLRMSPIIKLNCSGYDVAVILLFLFAIGYALRYLLPNCDIFYAPCVAHLFLPFALKCLRFYYEALYIQKVKLAR